VDTQAEMLDGMPEPEDMSHGWTMSATECYDHEDGAYYGVYGDEMPFENKEGHIMCKEHNVECEVEMGSI
jgi:hypothetical protein